MEEIEEHHANSSIKLGGHWSPSYCTARHRVAIIIPYRNRDMQLRIFLNFMHPFLQKQQLDYQIFLVEPVRTCQSNKKMN
jgi:beta-1,4-galactosyltransferase 1